MSRQAVRSNYSRSGRHHFTGKTHVASAFEKGRPADRDFGPTGVIGTVTLDLDSEINTRIVQLAGAWPNQILWVYEGALAKRVDRLEYGAFDAANRQPVEIDHTSVQNGTELQESQTVSFNKSVQLSQTWSVTHAVSLGIRMNFGISAVFQGGVETQLSFSSTESKSESVTRGCTTSVTIPVPPGTRVEAILILDEVNIDVPFEAAMVITGLVPFDFNDLSAFFGRGAQHSSIPVGTLFTKLPHADVTVVNDTTISCTVKGRYVGVHGTDFQVITRQFPIAAAADSEPSETKKIFSVSLM